MVELDGRRAPAFLRYRWTGEKLTPGGLAALRQRLQEETLLTSETRLLVDSRALDALPSLNDMRLVIAGAGRTGILPAAIAFVVATGPQEESAKDAISMMPATVKCEVFTDTEEAWRWLEGLSVGPPVKST